MNIERRLGARIPARLTLLLFLGAHAPSLHAEPGAQAARRHFEQGYGLVEAGKLDAAIAEFERAYELSPHFSVLYNLGQAYATLGRSVEAVDRLERYLSLGGASVPKQRRDEVRETIDYHSTRIGTVVLDVRPADARVSIDGRPIEADASTKPVQLNIGVHGVVAEHARFASGAASIRVEPGLTTRVVLHLQPVRPAELTLSCQLPDVTVSVDGTAPKLLSPRESLALSPGIHELRLQRVGYLTSVRQIRMESGKKLQVPCALAIDPTATNLATLTVRHPLGTAAFVDGAPHRRPTIPAGKHRITVTGPDHEREERLVTLTPRGAYAMAIMPSASSRVLLQQRAEHARTRRSAAYVTGSVGLAATLTAGALYLYNGAAYRDWRSDNARLVDRLRTDPESVMPSQLDALLHAENRIRNRDAAAIGMGVFGLAAVITASVLLLWPDAPREPVTATGMVDAVPLRF